MGIQFVCAKHVNRGGVVTTIVTATVTNLVSRFVSQSQPTSTGMNNTGESVAAGGSDISGVGGVLPKQHCFL